MGDVGTTRRGLARGGYWAAVIIAVAGLLAALLWAVAGVWSMSGDVADFTRVEVPGERTLTVQEPANLTIFYEAPGVAQEQAEIPQLTIVITDPDGAPVTVAGYGYEFVYETGAHSGRAVATFPAPEAGDYRVQVEGDAPPLATIAIGENLEGYVAGVLGAGLLALVTLGAAITVAALTWARRRESTPTQPGGPPPVPLPPPPPPPARVPATH